MSNTRKLALPPGLIGPPRLIRPGGTGHRVRNVSTGRVLPCCWDDCTTDGDDRYRIEVPHEKPRWRTPDGRQEMLVYIFCSEVHKGHYLEKLGRG